MHRLFRLMPFFACAIGASSAIAESAPFDLSGPALRVTVTRAGQSLPIAEVPQLAAGDRISVRADLPSDQSAHYILVAAFLRGSTNPPPDRWFFKSEPWKKKERDGLSLTVPADAEQVALFLAPETGGDFPTLREAVQGRPGAFVRAAQELAQASLDRSRLDTYLASVRKTVPGDPDRLTRITPLLARSLQIKVNSDCLTKMPSLQAACLLQNQESLVLSDGHSNAITDAVSGPGADLALQLSATPQAGLGYYSPYIAAIRDVVGILSSLRTAKYQYIPALATFDDDRMNLVLNAAPSFHNPKSVLVAALPIVAPTHIPPLQIPEASPSLCRQNSQALLPMIGAPLIYATRYAHDLSLRASLADGRVVDLPAAPDAEKGGLAIDLSALPTDSKLPLNAHLHGVWGFQPFDGPTVVLQSAKGGWQLASDARPTAGAVIALTGGSAACVSGVTAAVDDGAGSPLTWAKTGPEGINVTLPSDAPKGRPLALTVVEPSGAAASRIVIGAPRPIAHLAASVIARSVQTPAVSMPVAIALASDSEVPSSATLTVSLRLDGDARWTGKESVQIAADHADGPAILTGANGLTFLDDHVAIATLQLGKMLGGSAFGALRARVLGSGSASDWLQLGTLVRLPTLTRLDCSIPSAPNCRLFGDSLYLIQSVATTPGFDKPTDVPIGYPAPFLDVPRPVDGGLYVRLHDAPDIINRLTG
jgi:hypothetical protein